MADGCVGLERACDRVAGGYSDSRRKYYRNASGCWPDESRSQSVSAGDLPDLVGPVVQHSVSVGSRVLWMAADADPSAGFCDIAFCRGIDDPLASLLVQSQSPHLTPLSTSFGARNL